ncbi:multifunctional oxoglutarate decarboxylase/oxoglutarate dehydrogenase thiamine pyrophosphate-binding subunit/dihydrolipoyllysine-residue succinyltransferase subunit [Bacteroidota bacterium]
MINLNTAFENELYYQYLKDPGSVSEEWRKYFEKKGKNPLDYESHSEPKHDKQQTTKKAIKSKIYIDPEAVVEPLNPISSKIAANMEESIEVPSATSTRIIPVKALDENRRIINKYLQKMKRSKVSFTHMLAWALVKALNKHKHMNDAYMLKDAKPHRIKRKAINIGLAIDIVKKDGSRLLLVPNVKNAQRLNFSEFIMAFDTIIHKARNNKLEVDDLQGTTITLTNPGMIGTSASSPRLMKGQGLIVATGSINYPPEFQAVRPEVLTTLAISKVVTMTSTYDHRILQGAESAEFLDYLNKLLIGEDQFYDQIFAALKIPFEPIRWATDNTIMNRQGKIDEDEAIEKAAHVMMMINAYRVRGHLLASINPLGFLSYYYPELDPAYYGFTIWDLDRFFHADDAWEKNNLALRDIIEISRETYCGSIGIEFMHIQDPETKHWIKQKLEGTRNTLQYSKEQKIHTLKMLIEAELFENFLHTKFVGHKRFSLEGSESIIVLLNRILEHAADRELNATVIGMSHRGRLNILTNIVGKSRVKIFKEFSGQMDEESFHGSGDVKYHLGATGEYSSPSQNTLPVILSPNPSHLELVDPVIEGMARALDTEINDYSYTKTLPIQIHGDSAFAGQGIVAETLNLSQLDAYKTGGTIHIIINNQIGFTTTSDEARSSIYCTDVAKMIQVPILHVNGNDPEAVMTAATFAYEYREKFHTDVIIDVLSYRKYGHNEADEPSYTQPLLYKKIKSISPVSKIYRQELIKEGIITQIEAKEYYDRENEKLNKLFTDKEKASSVQKDTGITLDKEIFEAYDTSVSEDSLRLISEKVNAEPSNIKTHPKLVKILNKRSEMIISDKPAIDWSMAEAFAFGTILLDGKEIRFSGQDSRRGTFSQRHSVLTDIQTEETYTPLNHVKENQAVLRIFDSSLSELAVLGFEYGYSVIAKTGLTLWEAQFGDFSNGAQAIVDQFISCAEAKWGQTSNLVMLLPHSYDGQGPEHSSARLERYLQQCAENNMIVCYLSTPAQYFHVLRRQILMKHKKPLIIMTPKSMLRHPRAVSGIDDFTKTSFKEIIDDEAINKKNAVKVKRILICTGKLYWELLAEKEKNQRDDVAIIRIEQLYPLNSDLLNKYIIKYKNATQLAWVQEEPQNMGAWTHMALKFMSILPDNIKLYYVGRKESAATATGLLQIHNEEQEGLIKQAFVTLT